MTASPHPPLVAFLSANPSSLTPLDLEGEVREIDEELGASGLGGLLRVESLSALTPRTLQRALLLERPAVVHFSGHGRGWGSTPPARSARSPFPRDLAADPSSDEPTGIVLQGDHPGALRVVSGDVLGRVFARARASVQLVVLNACHSAEQLEAIAEHVDFVIGMRGTITDGAAKVFSAALYRGLALGRTIQDAFELGVDAIALEGWSSDQHRPELRARSGADPGVTTVVEPPPDDDGMTWDVFIAHADIDQAPALRIAEELHHRHLRVFVHAWEVGHGEQTVQRREQGVLGSTHGIVAMSARTMAEPWVQAQYHALLDKAVRHERRLIPVLIGSGTTELPPFLRTRHFVDLRGISDEVYSERLDAIVRAIRGQRPGPPPRLRGRRR